MRFWPRRKTPRPTPEVILPPEGVPLTLPIAGMGVRMTAQIADLLITLVAAGCILLMLALLRLTQPQTLVAIGSLLFFLTRVPYYVLTELAWNGQTLGKRLMKIKVVSHDGGSLGTHAIVLRNLMKEAEVFLPGTLVLTLDHSAPVFSLIAFGWVLVAFLIPLFNPHRQRLGDMMAGTHVIHIPQPVLLKDLAREAPPPRAEGRKIIFLAHQLDHYGAFELQTLEGLLRAGERQMTPDGHVRHRDTLAEIIGKIRRKIGYADPVPPADHAAFLKAFYTAQRAHLEQRQLFGDRRADKHHAGSDPAA